MYRVSSLLLLVATVVVMAGCYVGPNRGGRYNGSDRNDPWYNDRNRGNETRQDDPECHRERGRVNEQKWRIAVGEFESRTFKNRAKFREAKANLYNDLRGAESRACDWERPGVRRLMDRVDGLRWNPDTGAPY